MTQQLHDKFAIIAGVPKCGSTSLFEYLSAHSDICGAVDKEVGFFFHPKIAHQQPYKTLWTGKFHTNNLSSYLNAFSCVDDERFKLDASTGYFYSPDTAQNIYDHLPNTKLIFIFRDPVQRFFSIFNSHRQNHYIPPSTSIHAYIKMQTDNLFLTAERTLITGKYAQFLSPFWKLFNHEDILLLSFTQLTLEPKVLMQNVCAFLDIDASFYDTYNFERHNPTHSHHNFTVDRIQRRLIMPMRRQLQRYPKVFRMASAINHRTWLPLYQHLNSKAIDNSKLPSDGLGFLKDYYKDEAQLLYELTGVDGLLE